MWTSFNFILSHLVVNPNMMVQLLADHEKSVGRVRGVSPVPLASVLPEERGALALIADAYLPLLGANPVFECIGIF